MASGRVKGITVEIGGNTTKLGQALKDVEKQSKGLQSELKGVNTLLKLNPSNVELLTQKQQILTENIQATKEKLETLKKTQADIQHQFEKGDITVEQYRDFQREIIATEQRLESLKEQQKEFGSITERVLAENSKKMKEFGSKMDKAGKKIAGVSTGVAAGLTASIIASSSLEDAIAKYIATTGKAKDKTEQYKKVLQSIHDNNYGADYGDIADKMRIVSNILGDLPDDKLQSVVEKSYMLEEAYGMDFQENIRGVNALIDQFGITADEAFELINQGAQKGLNQNQDLTDQIAEYSTYYAKLGFTAEDFFDMMIAGAKDGAYQIDYLNDAMKEFGIRTKDNSKSTNEAYKQLGLDVKKVNLQFAKGGTEAQKAFKTVVKAIESVKDPVKKNEIAVALFGTKFEDLEEGAVMAMTTASKEVNKLGKTVKSTSDTMYGSTQKQAEQTTKKLKSSFASLSQNLLPTIDNIIKKINGWIEKFNGLNDGTKKIITTVGLLVATLSPALIIGGKIVAGVGTMVNGIGKLIAITKNLNDAIKGATVVQNAHNASILANPYVLATAVLAGLVAGLVLYTKHLKDNANEADKNWVATNKLVERQKELTKELNENKKAREEEINSAKAQTATADILYKKIDELSKVESKSNYQKKLMKRLVDELNKVMPELNIQYNEEKDLLNMSTKSIYENIKAQKELVLAKAAQKNLTKIAEDLAKADIEHTEAVKQHEKNTKELEKARKELADFTEKYTHQEIYYNLALRKQHRELVAEERRKKESFEKSAEALKKNEKEMKNLNDEYARTSEYSENMFNQAEITKAMSELTDLAKEKSVEIPKAIVEGMESGKYAVPKTIEGLNKLIKFDDALQKAEIDGKDIPRYISDGLTNGKMSVEQAMKQVESVISLTDRIKKLDSEGKTIPKDLADNLKNGTITIEQATEALNNAVNFDKLVEEAKEKSVEIPEKLKNGIASGEMEPKLAVDRINALISYQDMIDKSKIKGLEIPTNIANGITSGKMTIEQANTVMNNLINFNKSLANIDKSSKDVPLTIYNGITSGEMTVKQANDMLNTWITFQDSLNTTDTASKKIVNDLATNIKNGKTSVEEANKQMNRWIDFKLALDSSDKAGAKIPVNIQKGILNGNLKPSQAIKQLNSAVKKEADKLPSETGKVGKTSGEKMAKELNKTKSAMVDAGINLIDGAKKGIQNKNKQNSVFSSVYSFGQRILSNLKASLKEHSPSKATEEMGVFLLQGLGIGIDEEKSDVLKKASNFGSEVLNSLQKELEDGVGVNADFNGTRNLMMNTLTGTNSTISTNSTAKDLQSLTSLMNKYMPEIIKNMGYNIVLDDNTMVGKLTPKIDKRLGELAFDKRRGR